MNEEGQPCTNCGHGTRLHDKGTGPCWWLERGPCMCERFEPLSAIETAWEEWQMTRGINWSDWRLFQFAFAAGQKHEQQEREKEAALREVNRRGYGG